MKKKIKSFENIQRAIATFLIPCLLLICSPIFSKITYADNSTIVSGTVYKITSKVSGKVLDIPGASTSEGVKIHQWTDLGGTNQQFKVTDVGGGYYKLIAVHSGRAIDDPNFSTVSGTQLQQATDNGSDAQKWQIVSMGNGYFKVVSKASGLVMDVSQASTSNGAAVQQWVDNGTDAQRWSFTAVQTQTSGTPNVSKAMFDDFNYNSSSDSALSSHGWSVRKDLGGPGPSGCAWSANNITFLTDPQNSQNKIMRLTSSTNGTGSGTSQAEILTDSTKYFAGTYGARVRFTDTASVGATIDQINETFFTISPLAYDNEPIYSECDFEYLANGGWGIAGPTMWNTSWYTYSNNPWSKDNTYNSSNKSYNGWHTLVLVISNGNVTYYIDGKQLAQHSGKYYPRKNMAIDFNLWFLPEGLKTTSGTRSYVQDVDWVYHAKDTVLTPTQVESQVQNYRGKGTNFTDNVN